MSKRTKTQIDPKKLDSLRKKANKEIKKLEKGERTLNEEEQKLIKGIDEEDKNYLDLGYTDDFWYYGFKTLGKDAIITTDKKIYVNFFHKVREGNEWKPAGENEILNHFDYQGYIGDIAPNITKDLVRRFLTNDYSINKVDLYNQIKEKILYYMDFGDEEYIADLQTCWIIATHCYPLFEWFPNIFFNAPSGSGKSKNAFILTELGFRGFDLGAAGGVSPAHLFRTLEGNRGTLLIDEYEQVQGMEYQKLVNQIINAGAKKDAYVIRPVQINNKWIMKKFPIFAPKIICNISGLNSTTLSRCIGIKLLKSINEKSNRNPYSNVNKAPFKPIKDDIQILVLNQWRLIKEAYEGLETGLKGRHEDNFKPILAIAKFIGNGAYKQVEKYIQNYEGIIQDSNSIEESIFRSLLEKVNEDVTEYLARDMASWIDDIQHYKNPAKSLGKVLGDYKIKHRRFSNGVRWKLSKSIIQDIINRYFSVVSVVSDITPKALTPQQQTTLTPKNKEKFEIHTQTTHTTQTTQTTQTTPGIETPLPVEVMNSDEEDKPGQQDNSMVLGSIISVLDANNNNAPIGTIVDKVRLNPLIKGVTEEDILKGIDVLKSKGDVAEHKKGYITWLG